MSELQRSSGSQLADSCGDLGDAFTSGLLQFTLEDLILYSFLWVVLVFEVLEIVAGALREVVELLQD